ncbi:hypothetical protein M409DRAFT_67261 [Zasmidium cellare ATCC 36951]|uniref:FAD-binding domain-containing protein n=1 Tax=Zasmidium cellare ATCC 36951 TaxID=1080233 RepID=A0A6A6CDZ1_ZASCE|nr:uncharacterized protein M409DRAFT_67261 [Zasmidium cellare ATCC 36951]KAF2165437.1 hypothetical protein M409DRAFT_67261 [Zasmidium cellare ATCC 36951]
MASTLPPMLIIGGGISGLTLAQACRKENLPSRIFERDESPTSRSAGWGITLNSALSHFKSLLPDDVLGRLPEALVNKAAVEAGEKGDFTFYDLSNGDSKWKVPTASERIRVSRHRLRRVLCTGLDVEWGKTLASITKDESGVHAHFTDGTSASGSFLVACDGAHSAIRKLIHHEKAKNYELPIRFLGAGVTYTEREMSAIRNLDAYFFHGSDPRTDVFLYFSFLEAPGDNGAPETNQNGEKMYRSQIVTSWPYREGFLGRADPSDVPNTDTGRRSWMKSMTAEWAEPFRFVVQNLPHDCEIKPVELSDWVPQPNEKNVFDGRVVLLGDAFHAMVMYRGEGANQSIVDIANLLDLIKPIYQAAARPDDLDESFRAVTRKYEQEVVARTELAVLASRQACLDAHDFKRINEQSPLLRRRVIKEEFAELQK